MKDTYYYIEVTPLKDKYYTGIPVVALNIASYFANKYGNKVRFLVGMQVLRNDRVLEIFKSGSVEKILRIFSENFGEYVEDHVKKSLEGLPTDCRKIGLYTFLRSTNEHLFDREIQLMYDLTPVVVPEFHGHDVRVRVCTKLNQDKKYSDYFVCISDATAKDLETYFDVPKDRMAVSYPGFDFALLDKYGDCEFSPKLRYLKNRKYVYVLGTIEPRKNIRIVLEYIRDNPVDDELYVFTGKEGWGLTFNELLDDAKVPAEKRKQIKYLGFVSESDKILLLKNAQFSIYPSLYEGFGLPVIESMALGTPVVTSYSSSLPEVGGNLLEYFDPFSIDDLSAAISRTRKRIAQEGKSWSSKLNDRAQEFTWEKFNLKIDKIMNESSMQNRDSDKKEEQRDVDLVMKQIESVASQKRATYNSKPFNRIKSVSRKAGSKALYAVYSVPGIRMVLVKIKSLFSR